MQRILLVSGFGVVLLGGLLHSTGNKEYTTVIPPGLRNLIPQDSHIERISANFQFTEGPVWHKDGYLLFSDIPANTIYMWKPGGNTSSFRTPSGNSNGLAFDCDGRVIICEHGNRRVSRLESDGKLTLLASHYGNKRLNSPNDVVVKSDGSVYFTDPPYGVDAKDRDLDFQGVYRISPEGRLTLLVKDFAMPNGLAFSPDEKVLYITDSSERMHIRAFQVMSDGTLANGRIFAELKSDKKGAPDGLKVDSLGNLWVAGPGGVWVFNKNGEHLGTLKFPEIPANCAWGDPDGKTLYVTARTGVYRIRTNIGGIRP